MSHILNCIVKSLGEMIVLINLSHAEESVNYKITKVINCKKIHIRFGALQTKHCREF